jgi:NAD(P)-dependent dehydrogenase (short-subunit alcohol dehydrogenase family)
MERFITRTTLSQCNPRAPRTTDLAGSVALVTGGGRGVGRMIACTLAHAGGAVGVIARSADELEETVALVEAAGATAAFATADVSDAAALARAVARLRDQLGPVDVLINNAGILGPVGPTWEVDASAWWQAMDVNVRGMLNATQLVVPEMVERRRGRVLNIASEAGVYRWPLVSAYSVSKAAVAKLSENLARETARYGVAVFSVHPGLLPIGLAETGIADDVAPDSYEGRIRSWVEHELANGGGAEPAAASALILRIAAGEVDALSGRHLSVHDDVDEMLERIDDVREHDLYLLHPRGLSRARVA